MSSRFLHFLHDLPAETIVSLQISSASMLPLLKIGDRVLVKKTEFREIEVGDIIVFSNPLVNPEFPIVHRVIEKNNKTELSFRTKGDYSPLADKQPVTQANFIGKMIKKESFLKTKLLNLLQKLSL